MLRIILIITLILLAIPFFNKAKDYAEDKAHKAKIAGQTAVKAVKYWNGEKKEE